jgi:hypothetical protein
MLNIGIAAAVTPGILHLVTYIKPAAAKLFKADIRAPSASPAVLEAGKALLVDFYGIVALGLVPLPVKVRVGTGI